MRNSSSLRWYFALFDFVARDRALKNDLDLRVIHAHLVMVLSTGVLMWSYAVLACYTFTTPIPGYMGLTCSLIHLLSPLLYLVSANAFLVCSVALGAGLIHQMTFAWFSGGFESCILMWLPILPLLGGFIEGKKSLIVWMSIVGMGIGVYLGLHTSGFVFPMLISYHGYQAAQVMLLFGWLFILFCTTWVHVSMKEFSEHTLKTQGEKIDDLFRVLFHDLANSLGRINIGMSLLERDNTSGQLQRGLQVIKDASGTMTEITQNVRRMYAVSKGKADVDLSPCELNTCIEHLLQMFASELDKKKLKLNYDFDKHKGLSVIVDQVSFNNQVLANIFSNAIKFSDPGSEIHISSWPVNHHMVALEIKDSGIGMPEQLLTHLFDMNKRTSRPGTSGESGTGFGMHIMKSFVEMYQGQVQIDSVERVGNNPSGTSIRLILKGDWKV